MTESSPLIIVYRVDSKSPQRIAHLTHLHAMEWIRVLTKDGREITILDVIMQ